MAYSYQLCAASQVLLDRLDQLGLPGEEARLVDEAAAAHLSFVHSVVAVGLSDASPIINDAEAAFGRFLQVEVQRAEMRAVHRRGRENPVVIAPTMALCRQVARDNDLGFCVRFAYEPHHLTEVKFTDPSQYVRYVELHSAHLEGPYYSTEMLMAMGAAEVASPKYEDQP
jgi:hypothetical protein